jgi:hypothetical protein
MLQKFYTKLGHYASEVVFVPQMHFGIRVMPLLDRFLRRVYTGQSLEMFRLDYRVRQRNGLKLLFFFFFCFSNNIVASKI